MGIYVLYRAPLEGKHYTTYAELDSNFAKPILTGCIFDEHPTQQTLKKLGWMSELQEASSIIHVDYDLPGLQQGALFIVPSGIDNAKGRVFRVVKMSVGMYCPTSVTCEIVPEYENTFVNDAAYEYTHESLNLLDDEHLPLFNIEE